MVLFSINILIHHFNTTYRKILVNNIIFGPRGGNAHAQDEFVKVDDLILLTKIFLYVVLKWCGGKIN